MVGVIAGESVKLSRPDAGRPALVHDYLTQRGGAERVVVSMLAAFPGAPLHTALYHPEQTFPELSHADVRTLPIDRVKIVRRNHRLALPVLAPSFSRLHVDAEVTICSSSGWAHGARTTGRKIVYCHSPARWLYQRDRYLGDRSGRGQRWASRGMGPALRRWDASAARSADRYVVNSTAVRDRVKEIYGIDAEILHPSPGSRATHSQVATPGLDPGYWLCVSRLLPYKNLDEAVGAFESLPGERLVLVGRGPDEHRLRSRIPSNVVLLGGVDDARLAWLYANCRGLVAASHEDFGLTPLEANTFGKPVAALAWGGFLDTVCDGLNGCFFDEPSPEAIRETVCRVMATEWSTSEIVEHASFFDEAGFVGRLRDIVAEERALV